MSLRVAKIHEHAIAHVFGDEAAEAAHGKAIHIVNPKPKAPAAAKA